MKIRKILHPTDFSSAAGQALKHALGWARRHDAELVVLHVVESPIADRISAPPGDIGNLEHALEERAGRALQEILDAAGAGGVPVTRRVVRAPSAAEAIEKIVEPEAIDLVVMGSHGRRGFRSMFIGSVSEAAIRQAPCPVLAIPESPAREAGELGRILVPIDFSPYAVAALRVAGELAEPAGATLLLLHVIEQVILPDFYYAVSDAHFAKEPGVRTQAEVELRRMVRASGASDLPYEVHVVDGQGAIDIVRFAEQGEVDLVVMPTHGLSGVQRLLLGSVTDKVLRMAPCPVLALKPFGRHAVEAETEAEAGETSAPRGSAPPRRRDWMADLEAFSERNTGRRVVLEVDDSEIGAQQILDMQLGGISYDPVDDEVEIMFGGFAGDWSHLTHVILAPQSIERLTTEAGEDAVLRIGTEGGQTLLRVADRVASV